MSSNKFSDKQLEYIYNDREFVSLLSSYFSSYSVENIAINTDIDNENKNINWRIYLRILLANLDILIKPLEMLEKNSSFYYEENSRKISGGIKGRLNVSEYVKLKSMVKTPREYPCIIKEKDYRTVENEYLAFIIFQVLKKLDDLLEKLEVYKCGECTEKKIIKEKYDFMFSVTRKYPIKVYRMNSILKDYNDEYSIRNILLINTRMLKGKVRNAYAYKSIFNWYEKYGKIGLSSLNANSLKYLSYDEEFSNKLFELWNLHRIAIVLQEDFDFNLVDKNELNEIKNRYIYKLENITGHEIEIYYQRGFNLYWDNNIKQNWKYISCSGESPLIGIPDISIKYIGDEENIVIIDLKNKIRDKGKNSEEIYKIIGYFYNFKNFMLYKYNRKYKNKAILIFRNDRFAFEENLISNEEEKLLVISTGLESNYNVNKNQFIRICNNIVDIQK